MSLEKDLDDRAEDSWWVVELFRIVKGRLPFGKEDDVTKLTAKEYLDRFYFGAEKFPSSHATKEDLDKFAFHVYASTNLAYKNDLICSDCCGKK